MRVLSTLYKSARNATTPHRLSVSPYAASRLLEAPRQRMGNLLVLATSISVVVVYATGSAAAAERHAAMRYAAQNTAWMAVQAAGAPHTQVGGARIMPFDFDARACAFCRAESPKMRKICSVLPLALYRR